MWIVNLLLAMAVIYGIILIAGRNFVKKQNT